MQDISRDDYILSCHCLRVMLYPEAVNIVLAEPANASKGRSEEGDLEATPRRREGTSIMLVGKLLLKNLFRRLSLSLRI